MNKIYIVIISALFIASCKGNQGKTNSKGQDQAFEQYKEQFDDYLWAVFPDWGQSLGYHQLDSVLAIPDSANREREVAFAQANLDSLKQFNFKELSDGNKTDYYMIKNELERIIWRVRDLKAYEWDPSSYNVSENFATMLSNNYDSMDNRLRHFFMRMEMVPAYYEAAKKNIKNPTKEHTALAIEQNLGGISVFEKDLPEALAVSHLGADEKKMFTDLAAECIKAMKGYADWLKNFKNESPRSFRLGKELYAKKFDYDIQSKYTIDEVYEKALAHKRELHEKMAALATQLWPKYMAGEQMPSDTLQRIRKVIDKISLRHVHPDSFQVAIEKQLGELTAFIKEKDLIYIDPSKPLVVRKEPAYMAGVAGASITSAGPYDKNGNTYYNVGSLSGWKKDKAESYLREYNHYILQILNIHEAIPGHYTQLVYSNQSPSIIKSIFGNGTMVEGWAVYTERMMLENGYGNNDPEMWLMYYKWNLRSTCNTILDYSVHVKNMSRDEALHLLVDEAFQQQAEAEGKWKRVSVTQVQLCSYFTGYSEIYDFREELKKKMGGEFNLKKFHEKFLSYGSAPVKYIREMW